MSAADPDPVIDRGAISPCCGAAVIPDPIGHHCSHCGIGLVARSPYAD